MDLWIWFIVAGTTVTSRAPIGDGTCVFWGLQQLLDGKKYVSCLYQQEQMLHSRFLGGVQAKVDFSLILLHHLVANVTKLAVVQGTQLIQSKTPPKCNLKIEPNLENELYGDCADNVDTV